MVKLVDDSFLPSIQGEQQARRQATIWAEQEDVDTYVEETDPKVLPCRTRARHFYPQVEKNKRMHFEAVTAEGFLVRRVLCIVCEKVYRLEDWDVRHKGDKVTRMEMVRARPDYLPGYLGRKGKKRMKPKQIASSVATISMQGQSFSKMKKEAIANAQKKLA